ncbi:unnamed protein product [Moneuplotes crassus]|uniref:Uncharacterized protein n=1 Tax=Euplotes crassus TaxID=5936 RepID=A0AAD1XIN5_EUPCR|nr:unnamed protein product [Moneuplotes crassus]
MSEKRWGFRRQIGREGERRGEGVSNGVEGLRGCGCEERGIMVCWVVWNDGFSRGFCWNF